MPNRPRKQKPIRFRNRGDSPLTPATPEKRQLLLDLALELQQMTIETMERFGVSRKEQMGTYRRALRGLGSKELPSNRVMEKHDAIADLLRSWRHDKHFLDVHGSPRVLPIRGKGASLETLARKFVPKMPLSEVVAAITRHGEARAYRGDKVALLGGIVVLTPKTAEMMLAQLAIRIRRVSNTLLHNASLPEGTEGLGRFERHVFGALSDREFKEFARMIRPQSQDLCERADSAVGLATRKKTGRKRKTSGLSIFVFRDD